MHLDYIKYACGNAVAIVTAFLHPLATAFLQPVTTELVWRGRVSWTLGTLVGILTLIKLIKDLRKK